MKLNVYVMRLRKIILCLGVLICFYASSAQKATIPEEKWFDQAIIYQVTPSAFTPKGTFPDIQKKLPELALLGVNVLYLQPVTDSHRGGQGYDVTDYFSIRADLGTAAELKELVATAKRLGMRVIFDFVPNHTSVFHPFAQDVLTRAKASPFYDYYQHEFDTVPYSSLYHKDSAGFVHYFWKQLVNLNFNNEKVQRWIIDACSYWLKEYDIDGYRFDAVWAINARSPLFGARLSNELKEIKPGFMMLAEDRASDTTVYHKGFDVAYDWTSDTAWVSHWSWQYKYDTATRYTVFNHPSVLMRKKLLRQTLFSSDPSHLVLRFMENNDLHRFIISHSAATTHMVATLLFALPGIPMLYNGQEVGFKQFPYRTRGIFSKTDSIRTINPGLFDFYRSVVNMRVEHTALQSRFIQEVPLASDSLVGFVRMNEKEKILVLLNLSEAGIVADADLSRVFSKKKGKLQDLLRPGSGVLSIKDVHHARIDIPASTALVFLCK